MGRSFLSTRWVGVALFSVLSGGWLCAQDDDGYPLAPYYGFLPVEITKVDMRAHSIVTGDFNHDGQQDLALANNGHSRIDLLLGRSKPEAAKAADKNDRTANQVVDHWRLNLKKLPVDRPIAALAAGDLNADGKTDLAYFGTPDRVVVLTQDDGSWKTKREFRMADIDPKPWCVSIGDLNNDTLQDLVVLGKRTTSILFQQKDGTLANPVSVRNTAEDVGLGMLHDLDGDGRNDLFYSATDKEEKLLCARLQDPQGQLGPELRFDAIQNPRGFTLFDLDGKPGSELLVIDGQTNRVRVMQVRRASEGELGAKLIQYGVGGGSDAGELALGDLDGDRLLEVVVSNPERASVVVFQQRATSGLDLGTDSPSFLGVTQLKVRDLNGDGKAEVLVLSPKENALGISRLDQNKLTFPESLPIEGNVKAFDLFDIDNDGALEILAVTEGTGRGSEKKTQVSIGRRDTAGAWTFTSETNKPVEVKLTASVERLHMTDVNGDGRADYLFFVNGKPPQVILSDDKGLPAATATGGVSLGDVGPGAVTTAKLEEPALLVSQGNFVRSVRLDEQSRWQVVEQFNADDSAAKVAGSAVLDLDGKPGDDLVMVDTGAAKLRVFQNVEGEFKSWKTIDLGRFPYKSASVGDLNGDGKSDLVLNAGTKFGVLYAGQSDPELKEIASYESPRKEVFLMDLVAGDVNDDGHPEICVLDTNARLVEIVAYRGEQGLLPGINFKVFEEKSFQGPNRTGTQPREAVIADVSGDGRPDLILLCHDRVLVYPQDGPGAEVTSLPAVDLPKTVLERLKTPIDVKFNRTPLSDAFTYIGEKTNVNFVIDGDSLKMAGYTKNMAQTLSLGKVSGTQGIYAIFTVPMQEKLCLVVDDAKMEALITTITTAEQRGLKIVPVNTLK